MENKQNLTAQASIIINADPKQLWQALTDPGKIKHYLFGSQVDTDWNLGSPITFSREKMPGNPAAGIYLDKGRILEIRENECLKYTYFNSQEGYSDAEENYSVITYTITPLEQGHCKLDFLREHIPIALEQQNQQKYLHFIMEQIKQVAEKG